LSLKGLAEIFPDATLVAVERSGHAPMSERQRHSEAELLAWRERGGIE
jgi:hypothetical protein